MTTIELKNVYKTIHKKPVIQDISVLMQSGKVYGFQGINGSGKTMLMRLISGLIRTTQGQIIINGKTLGKDITFPESIGLFLENPTFLDEYSGFRNLKMLASIQNKISDDKIHETIELVGLDPAEKKKYRKYSLGMKQRLGIAEAIMEDPDIVIMDEPTNSIDVNGIELIKTIITAQKERGALVIVSCHDLPLLQAMSDEILLLESGRAINHLVTKE